MTSNDLLPKYLLITKLRIDTMMYSNLGNKNYVAGHIKCSCGPHWARGFPTPALGPLPIQYSERKA